MRKFRRGQAEVPGIVATPPADGSYLLTHWDRFDRRWIQPEDGGQAGSPHRRVGMVGHPGDGPRTRTIHRETGSAVNETLLAQTPKLAEFYLRSPMPFAGNYLTTPAS